MVVNKIMFVVYLLFSVLLSEASAAIICDTDEIPCPGSNETCISLDQLCDGEYDCPDGSDEYRCDESSLNTTVQSKWELAVVEAAHYLLNQRKADYGWDHFTPRALVALAFAEKYLPIPEKEKSLMVKRLDLQLFFLLKDGIDNLATLALNINALYAMCQDPRDFHGIDLVEILRSRTNKAKADFNLPIVLLTLCIANDTNHDDFNRLMKMYNDKRNDRIGVKALTLMAMFACSQQDAGLLYNSDMKMNEFIQDSRNQDSNIDVYSKALICQAYNARGYDTSPLRNELLNLQSDDGSFGDLLGTYSVIPALLNANLADLQCKTRKYKAQNRRHAFYPSDQMLKPERQVDYSLWIPNGENAGNHTLQLTFEGEKSFYDLMKMAEYRNPMYRFKYDEVQGTGKKVYYLAGIPNDAEKGLTWVLYRKYASSVAENSTRDRRKETKGVDWIFPQDNDHFVFQLENDKTL